MQKSLRKAGSFTLFAGALSFPLWMGWAATVFHVDKNIVVVSFTVKDSQGKYVTGLRPSQIQVREDGIPEDIQSFMDAASPDVAASPLSPLMASSVFILFDTSNCMYEGFSRSEDQIENFIRRLDARQAVAVYSFSQNVTRLARLTEDHEAAIRGLRTAAAGDSTAVLNATLITLRDAARVPGRKVIVVFSNGPDDASVLSPDDVARVSEEEGVPIYIISTKAQNEVCQRAFDELCGASGGKLFLAPQAAAQVEAFQTIADDMSHTYILTYAPKPNDNEAWRRISVELPGEVARGVKVESRRGYRAVRSAGD